MTHKSAVQLSTPTILQVSSSSRPKVLQAAARLFHTLNAQEIRYCHWKSNSRLQLGLEGRTDLDLLIDPAHKNEFKAILTRQGIKPISAPKRKQYPSMEHYLGFDPDTGRLFHLHVHYDLILGEQFVKNYSLPFGKQLLDSVRIEEGVKVPSPEIELILLSLRALLKYRDRDVIKDFFSIRSPGIPDHILNEIYWLLEYSSLKKVSQVLKTLPELKKPAILLDFLRTACNSPRDGRKLFQLRSGIRQMLRPYQRRSRFTASIQYLKVAAYKLLIQRSTPDQQMSLTSGGLMIALIGVDGSGKSTLSEILTNWLRWKLNVHFYYLGSKQPSIMTDVAYILFRMARRGHRELSAYFDQDSFLLKLVSNFRQSFLASHYYFVGRDRIKRYKHAKRKAAKGSVVVFDRFPFIAPLDGPQIHLIEGGGLNIFSKLLSRLEKKLYRKFEPVDLLILLNVSLKTSLKRKPDHTHLTIMSKNKALEKIKQDLAAESSQWNWVSLDTERRLEDVILEMKKLVWEMI